MTITLSDRFQGCLIGLAVGDAVGGRFEAQSGEHIRSRFDSVAQLIDRVDGELWYTDDTQMAIGVAETLADHGSIIEERLCEAFVRNYMPMRGYGRGARAVLDAMEDGGDYRTVASTHFPGGSYGNGAAMRVAPVGLFFRESPDSIVHQSRLSAMPTHVHELGIEGAQLLALAVAYASNATDLDRHALFSHLIHHCSTSEFRSRLEMASRIDAPDQLQRLGNGIEALESVVTAIASFSITPDSYEDTIGHVIFLGGDTDTIASMAGALCGAYRGIHAVPQLLIDRLEDSPQGGAYILQLAERLVDSHERRTGLPTRDT